MPDISKYLKQAEELDKKRGISSNPSVMPAVTPGGTVTQNAGPDISAYLAQAEKLDRERSAAPTTTPNTTRADGAGVGGNGYEIQMPKLEVNALGAGGGAREGGNLWDRIRDTLSGGIKQSVGGNVDTMGTMYEATQGQRDTLYDQQREWTAHQLARAEADLAAYTADGNAYMAKVTQGEVERLRTQLNAYDTVKQGQVQQKATAAARDMAAQVTQSGAQDIERAKEGLGLVGQALVDAGASGVQMLGDAGFGALTGVGGLAPMAFRAFGGGTQKARAEGADLDEQILYGGAQAAKEWVTEKLFSVALPFAKTYGKGSLDDVVEKSIGKAVDRFAKSALGKRALGGGLTLGAAALGEGLEEGLGTFLEWQLPRIYGGDVASFGETLEEAAYNTLVGSLSGLAGGVVTPQVWSYQQTAPQTAQGGAEAAQEGQNAPAAGNETPAPSTGTQRPQNTPVSFENTAAADILLGAAPQKQRAGFTSLENAMANQFERETGISIESVESILGGLANGDYNSANWVARIAQDAKDPKMVVVAHELTHHLQTLAPQEYESFRTAVADYFTRAGGEAALTDMMNRYRSAYGAAGQNLSDSAVMDEMAADFTEVLLTDADLFGQFAQQNRTLAERLLDALRAFIEKIRATFTGRARDAAAQEATGKTLSELEMIAEQWQGVYSAAAAAYGQNANTAINKERADAFLQTNGAYSASVGENIYSTDETVPQNEEGVKRYSLNTVGAEMDSDGRQLSEGQKAYFANSKVVDESGRLMPVYHGTPAGGFTEFRLPEFLNTLMSAQGAGFYFTDKKNAEQYTKAVNKSVQNGAKKQLYEVYLNITNPLEIKPNERTITKEQFKAIVRQGNRGWFKTDWMPFFADGAKAENQKLDFETLLDKYTKKVFAQNNSDGEILSEATRAFFGGDETILNAMKNALGKDGIRFTDSYGDIWVAWSANQIKNIDNLNPTDSPDIRYSVKVDSDGRQLSEGQKAYFANSKSVDAQGRLRVMYRGGNSNFTVFDRKKSSYANLYGRGFYFTDSKSHAEQYGGAREFYLNITNPVPTDETTITREQLLNFLQAVAENEDDYSFENYGYGATPESMVDAIYSGKSDFAMLYDVSQTAIGDMVEAVELFNEINGTDFDGLILDTETVIFNSEQAKLTDNKTPTDNPDIRFSLKSPVEETARLIALHNLTEEKLLGDLKLGGLPMPSIAVVLAEAGHAKYGDISLVFGKDTIDPQFMRRNKVYGGDAWTPTYPRVEYKVDDKALRTIRDKIRSLVPYETSDALGGLHLDSDNMTDTLNRYNGDMVDAFKRDIAMKYVYLKDTGSDISLPTKESDLYYYGEVSNAAVRYFAGKLVNGLQTVELYRNMGAKALMQDEALKEAVADALNWDVLRSLKPGSAEYTEYERNPVFRADEVSFSDIDKFLDASKKLFRTGVQKTVDYKAAKELIVDTVDQAAYESWLRNLFSEIVEKEGIRNNKDVFTPSGNRRSFEALHYEHNLENVIKAMRESGEKGIGFGGGSIFGAATTEFSSIEEMKQSSDRLQKMSEEEYQKMREGFSDRFFAIASSLPNNKGSFTATDDAANMLVEAVTKYNTKRGIANYLQRESKGWATYSEQAVDDLIKLVSDIRKMPTAYFEAKPQRAVGFDEVLAAVVPDNTGEALLSKLAERGINVLTYKKGDDADRLRAVNSVEDAKFSLKSTAPLRQMMAEMPQQMMIRMPRLTTVAQDEAEAAGLEAAPVEDTVQLPQLGLTDADVPGTEPLTRQDIARELAWRARMANEPAAPQAMGEVKLPELSADMDEAGMGVADFTGNVETVPQETTAEILSALEDLSRDMEAPMETPTDATVRDAESLISAETVEAPQSLKEKAAESWAFFKRKMVDSGEAVTQIGKAINDKYLYPFYNMARASASAGANMIAEEQTDVNGRTVGESLNAIFDPIRAKGEEYYTQFQTYMYDLHNIARMSMDQKAKQEQETAEAALAAYTADHPKFINMTEAQAQRQADSIDELEAEEAQEYLRLVRWVNRAARMGNKPVFDYDFTAEMSRGRSERLLREHPEFAQYREQVRKYIDNMMQYRVDSGLITQQDADFLREYYPDYIPTYRRQAFEDFGAAVKKKRVQIGKTVGRATGGNTKLVPLHEALGKQTMQVVREGSKNRFGARLLQDYTANASNADIARYVRNAEEYESDFSIDTFDSIDDVKPKRGNTFSVYLGGKLYDMTVDNALFEAVEALSPTATEQNTVTKVVRDVNKLYKALITGYNPTFAIRNTVRDLQTAGLYSRDFAAWAKNYPKALAEIKNDGPMWKQYKALGGDFSSVFDYMTGTVKKPTTKAGKVMDKVQALNMAMEQAPRLAEFMAVMEKGDGSMESAMDAMLAAADVTVNFGRGGTWGKMLNANYVPFLNPGIQGFDKMVRYATQSRSGKQWLMMAARAAALGIAPSLINALLYHDDEEWEELRDSDKDTNYMFKLKDGMWLKIPKGRELSVLGIAADRVGDALQGEEVDIRATLNTMANQVAPANPLNQNILKAAYDTQLFDPSSPGRTWYGGDIEGQRLQNYAPGERYDSSTDVVSKAIGGALNLSPKKLNYLADQYTGVVGDIVLPLLTPQAERDMFSKAFTVDSISSNELSGKFYEKSDELIYAKNGGDAVAAVVSRYWNSISSDVSKLYGEIRDVENSDISNREKKAQVQELQRQINAIQREALATVDQYTAAVESSLFGDDEDAADFAYRETNREVFGAKSALETYNKDVYAKAQEAAKSGVSYEAYYDYYFATKDIEGDKDASGKTIPGSKREKVLAEINAMDLTVEQKNALYYASGYAESTLYEAPWYTIQMPRL